MLSSARELLILQEKTRKKIELKSRLDELEKIKEKYEIDLHDLKSEVFREESDVEDLDERSAKNVVLKMTGLMKSKRLKEEGEAKAARERLELLSDEFKRFKNEYNAILKEYRGLGNCDLDYNDLKSKLFSEIKNDPFEYRSDVLLKLKLCEKLSADIDNRLEINQKVNDLIRLCDMILDDLRQAYNIARADYSTRFEMLGKFQHIERALPQIESLDKGLKELSAKTDEFSKMCFCYSLRYDNLVKVLDDLLGVYLIERAVLYDVERAIEEIVNIRKRLSEELPKYVMVTDRKHSALQNNETELFNLIIGELQ